MVLSPEKCIIHAANTGSPLGEKMQPTQEIIQGLWTLSHPQELLLHSLPCLLSLYSARNCVRNVTLVGEERKENTCAAWALIFRYATYSKLFLLEMFKGQALF